MQKAFKAVDSWNYGYIDTSNLKTFMIGLGYRQLKDQNSKKFREFLVAVLRRFDLNGDGKISLAEFEQGINPKPYLQPLPEMLSDFTV